MRTAGQSIGQEQLSRGPGLLPRSMGTTLMDDNESWANTRMSAVQSPASISQREQRRGTRALLLQACSLLGLAFVVGMAALFLSQGPPQDPQLSAQEARPAIGQGTR
jgi:hypothetical protein